MYFEEFRLSLSQSDWQLLNRDNLTEHEKILIGPALFTVNIWLTVTTGKISLLKLEAKQFLRPFYVLHQMDHEFQNKGMSEVIDFFFRTFLQMSAQKNES